jgi:hypothetical protein
MCLNSTWFFYNFFFLSKYLLITIYLLKGKNSTIFFLEKYLKYNNFFLAYNIFIVKNFTKMYIHKNIVFSRSGALAQSIAVVTKLFCIFDYRRFFSFFFHSFFHNENIIFFSFKFFFFDFLNFMTYLRDVNFFYMFRPLLRYYQEKKNRRIFLKIFKAIWKKYKPNIVFLFDYKYPSFFFKIIQMSNAFLVGFKYLNSNFSKCQYHLLLGDKTLLLKYLIFQQIFEIYTVAAFYRFRAIAWRFLEVHKTFLQ